MAAGSGEDGCEGARMFPCCLAVARYVVAAVVTVLAVVVIVMVVLVVLLRPDEISLSIVQGRVGATDLWKEPVVTSVQVDYAGGGGGGAAMVAGGISPGSAAAGGGRGGGRKAAAQAQTTIINSAASVGGPYRPETTRYVAAEYLTFDLILRADNPGGRSQISCSNITARLLDMPNGPANSTGMTAIAAWNLTRGGSFLVKQKSSHTLRRWASTNDTRVLDYVADTYGGRSSFQAVLWVTLNVSSFTTVAHTASVVVTHYCGPLTVSTFRPTADAPPLQCTPADQGRAGLFFRRG